MTFYYDSQEGVLVGNCAAEFAQFEDDGTLVIDPDEMSRGTDKLQEILSSVGFAIEAHASGDAE
jgi:hypothetical protein